MSLYKNRIVIIGGSGRFGKILSKVKTKYKTFYPSKKELKMRIFARKSIFAKKDIQIGERFTERNITCKRPGYGIKANKYYKILGKRSKKKFNKFEIINN